MVYFNINDYLDANGQVVNEVLDAKIMYDRDAILKHAHANTLTPEVLLETLKELAVTGFYEGCELGLEEGYTRGKNDGWLQGREDAGYS